MNTILRILTVAARCACRVLLWVTNKLDGKGEDIT